MDGSSPRRRLSLRPILRSGVVAFLGFPFLFLIFQFFHLTHIDFPEILWAAWNTFVQAFFSATFSLLFGLWGAMGLLCFSFNLRRRWRALLEMFLLLPNFLPAIFTLLGLLNLVDPFPMGKVGIILVHTAMNWGLAAVLLAGLIESKVGGVAELSWVEGAGRWKFLRFGMAPMLWKDLGLLWAFLFVVCFGSFAVPLVVGGSHGTTLEVLIFERIRLSTDWSQAVVIASLQSIFLFGIAFVAARGKSALVSRPAHLALFQSWTGVVLILAATFFLALGYLQGLPSGLLQARHFLDISGELLRAILGSLSVGLSAGMLCLGLLFLLAALLPSTWFEKFLTGFNSPSQALTAFAFLVISPNEGFWPFLKIPVTLTLLTLPILWRMGWQSDLDGLQRQREVSQTLGASRLFYFRHVVVPQLAGRASTLAGLAAVWAVGDFAVSRILAHQDLTLALMTETLMTGYRLGLATVLSVVIFGVSAICFIILKGVGRVLGRKPLS